jgi:hypothetical protein
VSALVPGPESEQVLGARLWQGIESTADLRRLKAIQPNLDQVRERGSFLHTFYQFVAGPGTDGNAELGLAHIRESSI